VKVLTIARKELQDLVSERVYILAFLVQMVIVMGIVFSALLYTSVSSPQPGGIFTPPGTSKVRVGIVGELDLDMRGLETVKVDLSADPFQEMASRGLVALLVVPDDLEERALEGKPVQLDLYLDNTNVLSGYADGMITGALSDLAEGIQIERLRALGAGQAALSPVEVQEVAVGALPPGIRGPPEFFELLYGVLIPFILLLPTFLATNMMTDSMVGEKERRTYELMLTLPITKIQLILGKALPIVLLAGTQAALWILLLWAKGIPVHNPHHVITLLVLLDMVYVGFGIAISSFSEEIKDANIGVTVLLIFSSLLFFAPVTVREDLYSISPITLLTHLASNPTVPPERIWPLHITLLLLAGLTLYGGSRLLDINDNLRV